MASQFTESACAGEAASSGATATTPAVAATVVARRRIFEAVVGARWRPVERVLIGFLHAYGVSCRVRARWPGRTWRLHPEAPVAPRNVWVPRSCLEVASRAAAAGLGVPARGSSSRTAPTVSSARL